MTIQNYNSDSTSSEYDIAVQIPNDKLIVGTNAIAIQTYDGIRYSDPYTTYLTKTDTKPAVSGVLDKLNLTAVLSDPDVGDTLSYRISLNSAVKIDWTEYMAAPFNLTYTTEQRDIILGKQNTLTIEVRDNLGQITSVDFDFVEQNYNRGYAFIM